MVTCMAERGFDYTPPPFDSAGDDAPPETGPDFTDAVATVDRDLASTQGFGRGDADALSAEQARDRGWKIWHAEPPNPGYDSLGDKGKDAYAAAAIECEPPQSSYDKLGEPSALSASLVGDLEQMVEDASQDERVLDDMERYPRCMADAGYPLDERLGLVNSFDSRYYAHLASEGLQAPRGTAWAEVQASEIKAALADAECRADANALVMTLLRDDLTAFAAKHRADFAVLDLEFDRTVQQADEAVDELAQLTNE